MVKKLKEKGVQGWDVETTRGAVLGGNIQILDWLLHQGFFLDYHSQAGEVSVFFALDNILNF